MHVQVYRLISFYRKVFGISFRVFKYSRKKNKYRPDLSDSVIVEVESGDDHGESRDDGTVRVGVVVELEQGGRHQLEVFRHCEQR